jgi:hypothetical protein
MKLRYLLMTGLALTALTSCNDYLDVDAPSKYTNDYVFGSETEVNRALNGVYAQLLSSNTYGGAYLTTFCMNSDVDFVANSNEAATNNGFARFECTSDASSIKSVWASAYTGVEYANNFIYNLANSSVYSESDATYAQMMGEAKVIRAIFYNDLIDLWGDVPFSMEPTATKTDFVLPVTDREEIRKQLIADLEEIAPHMQFSKNLSNTVERVSKEACWAMIARLALSAGGYSLHPDKENAANHGTMTRPTNYQEYYKIAQQYCDSVIKSGTHTLANSYENVFVDECNFIVNSGDDPIFEIPFAKKSTGNIGYNQGPTGNVSEGYSTGLNTWGAASGNARLNAFYRFSFDTLDVRRDFLNGMWYYLYDGTPSIRADYTVHNNKWSKFWSASGNFEANSSGSTGINYPYLRYADVLLMKAEVDNELNGGPTEEAKNCLKQVRNRAFAAADRSVKVDAYVNNASSSKEAFLKAVLNERKWEFAGENMRWKDLVRNNMYSEVLYYTFLRYYAVGENAGTSSTYLDEVEKYDGVPEGRYSDLPVDLYYCIVTNPKDVTQYPNTTLNTLYFYNSYHNKVRPSNTLLPANVVIPSGSTSASWSDGTMYQWWNDGAGTPTNQCMYSLYGFMRGSATGQIYMVGNDGNTYPEAGPKNLPVVRYILPYPDDAIQRSAGAYKNYYGYTK